MDHVAILKKKWLEKILSGEKTIESRWYKQKRDPYQNIAQGDMVYLKETGKPITARARVEKVLFFNKLTEQKIKEIVHRYGKEIGMRQEAASSFLGKNYCTLIVLKNPQRISPFQINKKGFGNMTAWITVGDIKKIWVIKTQ